MTTTKFSSFAQIKASGYVSDALCRNRIKNEFLIRAVLERLTTHENGYILVRVDNSSGGTVMAKNHLAMYGSLKIPRLYCKPCKCYALVVDDVLQCCDTKIIVPKIFDQRRMINCQNKRRQLSKLIVRKILDRQENKCIYCGILFGTKYINPRSKKLTTTEVCCDHITPFSYSQDSHADNLVGVCRVCNSIKSNKIFNTLEEAREYVANKRKKKGYTKDIYIF